MQNCTEVSQLIDFLHHYRDPGSGCSWLQLKALRRAVLSDGMAEIAAVLPYPVARSQAQLLAQLRQALQARGVTADIQLSWQVEARAIRPGVEAIAGVKNVIAVASGKGGVGKSTTAVNLAVALAQEGARVGLLDADIYGPNQPLMLGTEQKLAVANGQQLPPVCAYGVQSMSMGYLINTHTPMVWRGPMVSSALQQLARSTQWDDLDYLIVDLPPGTGDIQLTLAQKIPVNAVVIVTTPQDVALQDARKGLEMFRKVNVPVVGIVENMSVHVCSQCGHEDAIFGAHGAERLAQECGVELLGQVPLLTRIRAQADAGQPIVVSDPDGDVAQRYARIARAVAARVALLPRV